MPRERSLVVASLQSKGFELRQGSRDHDFFFFAPAGLTQAIFTKVSRGSQYRTLGDPLIRRMSRQLKLTARQFESLVDCPMTQGDFEAHLRTLGILQT